jgi:hypothetical protein
VTDNINPDIANGQNKIKKVLLFISIGVVIITAVLGVYYLYTLNIHSGTVKTNKNNTSSVMPTPTLSLTPTPPYALIVFTKSLAPGTIGKPYRSIIETRIPGINVQVVIKAITGLPKGLTWTPCSTAYNVPDFPDAPADKNSSTQCFIEGIPEESGNFKLSVYFSNEDGTGKVLTEFNLVINP